ncbi:MAG: hypothetical protein ACYTAN_16920 [Planctomycetota bacterium]|jgi:hypothetical protein
MKRALLVLVILVSGCATAQREGEPPRKESDAEYEALWEAALHVVGERFEIRSAEKGAGRIETHYLVGALSRTGLKSSAVGGRAVAEDFLHTIRRRAILTIPRGEEPMSVTVEMQRAVRERPDAVRGGTFIEPREGEEAVGSTRWIDAGRDGALEAVIAEEIAARRARP